ncbi:putative toxin subunit [Aspergillus steynii IBT 23096]|uniref:Putative toxin subunit n=1 Tax=Aspergillus steynii IBT 23096 TaxID=1392250 RepID=A0A2I2GK89_9EURO|nr:putative toxin subunit [Aspergillus steynii IBT 23096]PLB53295.1 putative toxin subunit [Aspergillus steynii IBT 23096]
MFSMLDDTRLKEAKKLLQDLVEDNRVLFAALERTRSISRAIDSIGTVVGATPESQRRLALLADLDRAAAGNFELASLFWNQRDIQSMTDAAGCYSLLLGREEAGVEDFQTRLFAEQPTATIYSLVCSGHLTVQPATIQTVVVSMLETAMSTGFNIAHDPVNHLLDNLDELSSETDVEALKTFFRKLQRLQALVRLPEDLDALLRSSFMSAHQIAHTPRHSFVSAIGHYGMPAERAVGIHDHAILVDMRNEQVWTELLASRNDVSLAALARPEVAQSALTPSTPTDVSQQVTSYTQIFGDVTIGACDDYNSVTSAAAYFVDLLRMLRNTPSDTTQPESPSLLDKLATRRPDLLTLQLSCVNTNVLIPYIDLANEAMESFIKNVGTLLPPSPVPIQGFNMTDQDTSEVSLAEPQHTDYSVYRDQIATRAFPLTVFPYSQALDLQRLFFTHLNASLADVMMLFGSASRLLPAAEDSATADTQQLAEDVLQSAWAAEYLGLSPADHVAITGTSIFSLEFLKAVYDPSMQEEAYNKRICRLGTAEYWGYEAADGHTAEELMLSEENEQGLPFVKAQLLRRAEITVADLLNLLRGRLLQRQLVLETAGGSGTFSGKLEDLRLRHPTSDNAKAQLTEPDCRHLQSYIRLWRRTGWTLQDLDCLVVSFGSDDEANGMRVVTAQTIKAMAAVQRIATLTGVDIFTLMPLWGLMDTNGDQSLYARLFLKGKAGRPDPVFGPDAQGNYLTAGASLTTNRAPLLAACGLTEEGFAAVVAAAKITNDTLDLTNVTAVYRIAVFCQLLAIDPVDFVSVQTVLDPSQTAFLSPQAALDIIQQVQQWTDAGLNLEQLLFFTGNDAALRARQSDAELSIQQVAVAASDIIVNIQSRIATLPAMDANTTTAAPSDVATAAAALYDHATAQLAMAFIEMLSGTPLTEDSTVYQSVLLPYFSSDAEAAHKVFFEQPDPTGTDEEKAIAREEILNSRRVFFLQHVIGPLHARVAKDAVLQSITPLFPDAKSAVLSLLLEMIQEPESQDSRASRTFILAVLSSLATSNAAALGKNSSDVFFRPSTADLYRFFIPDTALSASPKVTLDGSIVLFDQGTGGWTSKPVRLSNGQAYSLRRSDGGGLANSSYLTERSPSQSFPLGALLAHETVDLAQTVLRLLSRAVHLSTSFELSLDEVQFFQDQSSNNGLSMDWGNVDYPAVQRVKSYREMSRRLNGTTTLLDFLKWTQVSPREGSLVSSLTSLTKLSASLITDYLEQRFAHLSEQQLIEVFAETAEIARLLDRVAFMNRTGVPGLTLKLLFTLATPVPPPTASTDFDNAAQLRLLLQSTPPSPNGADLATQVNGGLRVHQRDALVNYLLHHPYITERGIADADGLFEFLLIDVQMGACLQTSRIKQAISTVQVYVRRCILGLEKAEQVASNTVNLDRWAWIESYRLWEANRKVFLYPENWLEASLRDDKTEIFQALESGILQNDLDSAKIVDLVKAYVYGVDAIADLDVQAYLWKKVEDYTGSFHFFARTRTAPYIYYYRTLDIVPNARGSSIKMYWQPWTKIDVEVPVHEVGADGKPLPVTGSYLIPALYGERLFLFFPQITLKTDPNSAVKDTTIKEMGDQKPDDMKPAKYWQVQIGWTEYRNGRWTPKQISQAILEVRGAQDTDFPVNGQPSPADNIWKEAQKLPEVSSLKFWIRSRSSSSIPSSASGSSPRPRSAPAPSTSILVIEVERWICAQEDGKEPQFLNYPLGRFEMRGSQVILADLSASSDKTDPFLAPWRPTIPTVFAKMSYHMEKASDSQTPGLSIGRGAGNKEPLLGIVTKLVDSTPKKDVVWTLSFNDSQARNATGFIQDIVTTESTISYVTYPPISSTTTFASDVFQHTLDRDLVSMSTTYDGVDQIYAFLASVPADDIFLAFGKRNGTVHELSTPYALYNWEIGAHTVMLLMERLQVNRQYDLALQVAHLVFDPTVDGSSLDRCWLFPPFKELADGTIDSIEDILGRLEPSSGDESEMKTNILDWRKHPFNAHSVARSRPLAYMRRIIINYIEILIASGDVYFRQNTLEALPLAIQRYVEASHIFGSAPVRVPQLAKPTYQSYADLASTLDDFSNAAFDMELDFPFVSDPASRGAGASGTNGGPVGLTGVLKTTYFCVPANPKLVELRDLIDDRLFKIRHCQDINGVVRSLALFEPPLDPGLLVRAAASGVDISQLVGNTVGPMPNYRFQYLLQKALDMCAEVKSMGASLLSIKERKDTEALANLHARQDKVLQGLMVEMKKTAKKEAEASIDALLEARKAQVARLEYYLALTGSDDRSAPDETQDWEDITQSIEKPTSDDLRMTSHEKLEMEKADAAAVLNQKATVLDIAASVIKIIPDISEEAEPLGVGVSLGSVTKNICEAMLINASVMRFQAQSFSEEGSRASRTGSLIRQLQERRLQANMAGRDIKGTDKQIATSRIRVEMCERDIKLQQQQADFAQDTEAWLRTKYTSEELYAWMDGVVRDLYHQTYLVADDLAQKAQAAFRFEKGDQSINIINSPYWDDGRDGLFAGENLFLSLKRLEAAYMEQRLHDVEVVKNVSLRQIRPWALLELRETGTAEFDLPEVLFDFDFPGHYCRRIKSISMTVPCLVGPYTGVNATLTLLEHSYRVKSDAKNAKDYPRQSDDARFQTDRVPIASIAVSHGQQDSGVFNLDFRDERYIPFEGAGAVSRWRLELPTAVKQFDYNTISDIVLQVKYTAVQGGAAFHKAASDAAIAFQKTAAGLSQTEGLFALLDLKNDFPTEWQRLVSSDKTKPATMPLLSLQDRLPFFTRGQKVKAETISVLLAADSDSGVNMAQDIALTASSQIPLEAGTAIGSYQVAMAADQKVTVADWSLTLSANAMSANVERIIILFRYIM